MPHVFSFVLATATISVGLAGSVMAADDSKLALVPTGPHAYFSVWEQAAADAVKDFGLAGADYRVPQKWDLSQQNQLLESLLTQNYNGFLMFPGDPVGSASTVDELVGAGAPVIAVTGCLKDPSAAAFCLASDAGKTAYVGTQELLKVMGGKKRIAHFTGFLVDPNTQLRIDAVKKAADEAGAEVMQVITDIDAPELAEEKINAYLAAHASEVDGIITTSWTPSAAAATALRKIGDKRIKMVALDHSDEVLTAIKDGYVNGTILQNPYGQGYIGAFALDKLRSGCSVKEDAPFKSTALTAKLIDSGTAYVTADKVDTYIDVMREITKNLRDTFQTTYLNCP